VPWPPSRCVGSIIDYAQSNFGVVALQKGDALQQCLEIEPDPVEAQWAARDTDSEPHGEFVHKYSVVWKHCHDHDGMYSGVPTVGTISWPSFLQDPLSTLGLLHHPITIREMILDQFPFLSELAANKMVPPYLILFCNQCLIWRR
jgi:hypothetical protein